MEPGGSTIGRDAVERYQKLSGERGIWDQHWQAIGNYVVPRKAHVTEHYTSPDTTQTDRLYDTTAVRACMTLASGQLSLMTPMEQKWFQYDAPKELVESDAVKGWFSECSQIIMEQLQLSNLYTEIHEHFLDRAAFGTACLYLEEGEKSLFNFQNYDVGTYCIAENNQGTVDSVFREVKFTLRQAVQEFGLESLSNDLQKQWANTKKNPAQAYVDITFIHACYPRTDRDPTKLDAENKPIASIWVEQKGAHLVRESGYDEFPYMTSRYLKWERQAGPYGWSPSWIALPEARQLNFLSKQLDALAELRAFPRLLYPDNLAGEVDLRSGGVTTYDSNNPDAVPKEWMTSGDYPLGEHRHEVREKAINDAYHVDLFKMFASLDKTMTAREVMERKTEKLVQFSPTFDRIKSEVLNPMLGRCFAIAMRAGALPDPPIEALQMTPDGIYLPEPQLHYLSKIALALEEAQQGDFMAVQEVFAPFYEFKPELMDNVNFDVVMRDHFRSKGLPEEWLQTEEDVAAARQARAEQAAQQAQLDQAEQMASAAGNVPPEMLEQAAAAG